MNPSRVIAMERWWSANRHNLSVWIPAASLALFLITASLFLAATPIATFSQLYDSVHSDTAVLYDVQHFQKTGEIYRDLSRPPYLPAQYSPLMYMMYSIPRGDDFGNPFFGARLLAIGAFLLCIAMTVSIVRTLIPLRYAWVWGLLLACSIQPMSGWVLGLRGDFPAIFFGLTSIRLLLAKPRYAVLLAGLSAGLATQFKFVYVTSLLAGSLWLLFRKRFREFGVFAAAGALTSVGLYFLFWLRETRMIAQILALSPGIPDFWGMIRVLLVTLETPVIVLAFPALPVLLPRRCPRWMLLFLFVAISFAIATATELQAGGAMNYYYEGLFAAVPLATFGTLQLLAWSRANTGLAIFVAGVALTQFLGHAATLEFHTRISPGEVHARNETFRRLSAVLRGQRIFSLDPRLALLDPHPALLEPYLASVERQLGKFDMRPLLERIGASEFDVVITYNFGEGYRGVPDPDPLFVEAITAKYKPYCTIMDSTLHFRRSQQPSQTLLDNLRDIGCKPLVPPNGFTDFSAGTSE